MPIRVAPLALLVATLFGACTTTAPASSPTPATPPAVRTPAPTPATAQPAPATPTSLPATEPPVASPTAAAPALEGRIVNDEQGYAVTLPDGWLRMDVDEEFMDALATELGREEAGEIVEQFGDQIRSMINSGMSLLAFRTDELGSGEFATNMNVISVPTGGMSLEQLEQLNVQQIESLPGFSGEMGSERVELPAGEALYLTYMLEDDATGATEIHQYLIVRGGRQHWLTVTGTSGDAALAAEARQMAESFEILNAD